MGCSPFGRLAALLVLMLTLSGCTGFAAAASYRVDLTTELSPPRSGQAMQLRARIVDEADDPVSGARVKLQAEHLGMSMGAVTLDTNEVEPGMYAARTSLSMSGPWKVAVTAEGPAGRVQRDFELQVIPGR